MTESRADYVAAAIINPEDLRDAVLELAFARRRALLQELADIERMLCVSPSTSELRREWRGARPRPGLLVKLKD